jgi:hypothetical protein
MYNAQPVTREQLPRAYAAVERLTGKQGLPMPKIYVLPTESPNAFATGRNPQHASVAVTHGILQLLDDEELEGVLAHELGHVKNRDILTSSIAATLAGAITMVARMGYWASLFGGGGDRDRDRGGGCYGFCGDWESLCSGASAAEAGCVFEEDSHAGLAIDGAFVYSGSVAGKRRICESVFDTSSDEGANSKIDWKGFRLRHADCLEGFAVVRDGGVGWWADLLCLRRCSGGVSYSGEHS